MTLPSSTRLLRRLACATAICLASLGLLDGGLASASTVPSYTLSAFAGVAGTSGPATSQEFGEIYSEAVNSAGDVFVVDYSNNTVDEITPSGQISVLAGGGGTTPTTTPIAATSAALSHPYAVAVDSSGDVYIADYGHYEVDKVTPSGELSVIAGDGGGGPAPVVGQTYTATNVGIYPAGLAVDSSGDVYIGDADDQHIYKLTPAGQLTIIAGNGGSGATANGVATSEPIDYPYGLATDVAGDVYFADEGNDDVAEVTPAGQLTILAGIPASVGHPTDGTATSSHLDEPEGLAIDAAGDLYVADLGDGDVSEITPAGQLTVIAGTGTSGTPTYGPGTSSDIDHPDAIASTAAGRLYVGDTGYHTVDLLIPPLPVNTVAPTVSGAVAVGSTLTAGEGSWTNDPILYSYQWQDCNTAGADCTNISGATSSTYTLTLNDASYTVRVVVTAQNGAGSATAESAAEAFAPITVQIGTVSASTGVAATLSGTIGAYVLPVSYQFQYGTTTSYGKLTTQETLAASSTATTVQATLTNLLPGTTYHYRLVVIGAAGQVTYGADQTFKAPKLNPTAVLTHIHEAWEAHAPYKYLVKGHLKITGLSGKTAFKTRGKVAIRVLRGSKLVAKATVNLTRTGTYRTTFKFTAAKLPGTGRLTFHISFQGNRQLLGRKGHTQSRFYGPSYRLLHRRYGFTITKHT